MNRVVVAFALVTACSSSVAFDPTYCKESAPREYVCRDNKKVPCAEAAGSDCRVCGCPSDQYCRDEGCLAKVAPGEPCDAQDMCLDSNCNTTLKRCQVRPGQPCTAQTCEYCFGGASGTRCLQRCYLAEDCVHSNQRCAVVDGDTRSFCLDTCISGSKCAADFTCGSLRGGGMVCGCVAPSCGVIK
ncbi:MAG: hypothetical protein HYV09_08400 [Deltaproteobacteria bacterium]|nr:hypothetical protein [Deltaproteobacteria bacterium]